MGQISQFLCFLHDVGTAGKDMANITVRSGCLAVAVDVKGNIAMVGTEAEVSPLRSLEKYSVGEAGSDNYSKSWPAGVGCVPRAQFPACHLG